MKKTLFFVALVATMLLGTLVAGNDLLPSNQNDEALYEGLGLTKKQMAEVRQISKDHRKEMQRMEKQLKADLKSGKTTEAEAMVNLKEATMSMRSNKMEAIASVLNEAQKRKFMAQVEKQDAWRAKHERIKATHFALMRPVAEHLLKTDDEDQKKRLHMGLVREWNLMVSELATLVEDPEERKRFIKANKDKPKPELIVASPKTQPSPYEGLDLSDKQKNELDSTWKALVRNIEAKVLEVEAEFDKGNLSASNAAIQVMQESFRLNQDLMNSVASIVGGDTKAQQLVRLMAQNLRQNKVISSFMDKLQAADEASNPTKQPKGKDDDVALSAEQKASINSIWKEAIAELETTVRSLEKAFDEGGLSPEQAATKVTEKVFRLNRSMVKTIAELVGGDEEKGEQILQSFGESKEQSLQQNEVLSSFLRKLQEADKKSKRE